MKSNISSSEPDCGAVKAGKKKKREDASRRMILKTP